MQAKKVSRLSCNVWFSLSGAGEIFLPIPLLPSCWHQPLFEGGGRSSYSMIWLRCACLRFLGVVHLTLAQVLEVE